MNPKKESKSDDITDSKSEKNGMTSAIKKAPLEQRISYGNIHW